MATPPTFLVTSPPGLPQALQRAAIARLTLLVLGAHERGERNAWGERLPFARLIVEAAVAFGVPADRWPPIVAAYAAAEGITTEPVDRRLYSPRVAEAIDAVTRVTVAEAAGALALTETEAVRLPLQRWAVACDLLRALGVPESAWPASVRDRYQDRYGIAPRAAL